MYFVLSLKGGNDLVGIWALVSVMFLCGRAEAVNRLVQMHSQTEIIQLSS